MKRLFNIKGLKKGGTYLIELLIVVVGVSIAFQLNVWKDNTKEKEIEKQLLLNFRDENSMNIEEMDSSTLTKEISLKSTLKLIDKLKEQTPEVDSIRYMLAPLYQISWPNYSSTHLNNYLNYTSSNTELRKEMLSLSSDYKSMDDLIALYRNKKEVNFFDYLANAVDMTSNLEVVELNKLLDIEFRNNLMFISAYEESIIEILERINGRQQKLDTLIVEKLRK